MSNVISILLLIIISFSSSVSAKAGDPTSPLKPFGTSTDIAQQQAQIDKNKLTLEAIIHGKNIHTVVINKKELQVGDLIGEYKLVAVNDTNVVLRSKEEKIRLYVFSGVKVK